MDYLLLTLKGVHVAEEMKELTDDELKDTMKIMVVPDLKSTSLFAHVVERKGLDDTGYVADSVVEDVVWTGRRRAILKSDNAAAIVQVVEEARRRSMESILCRTTGRATGEFKLIADQFDGRLVLRCYRILRKCSARASSRFFSNR